DESSGAGQHPIRLCNPDQLRLIGCSLPCLYHIEGVPFGRKNRGPILWLLTVDRNHGLFIEFKCGPDPCLDRGCRREETRVPSEQIPAERIKVQFHCFPFLLHHGCLRLASVAKSWRIGRTGRSVPMRSSLLVVSASGQQSSRREG